jgi:hypothetical protein
MFILISAGIGVVSGLIVSSWQGFKDPPWEGFFITRFLRSIVVGAVAGAAFGFASAAGKTNIDNLGVLAFAIVAVERVIGEAYKGFFRPGPHPEYFLLLGRFGLSANAYMPKAALGAGFLLGAYGLFRLLAFWLGQMAQNQTLITRGLAVGVAGGLLSAIGGALKDSQFEGFLPLKFFRSPIVGAFAGLLFIHFSTNWFLVALAVVGGERTGVELYKTFLKRQVRGIHAGKPVRYPDWLARRGVFAWSYGLATMVCMTLLVTGPGNT